MKIRNTLTADKWDLNEQGMCLVTFEDENGERIMEHNGIIPDVHKIEKLVADLTTYISYLEGVSQLLKGESPHEN